MKSSIGLIDTSALSPGYCLREFPFSDEFKTRLAEWVRSENWKEVDREFLAMTAPNGLIFQWLLQYHEFSSIETMISIRDGSHEWEEDGIWHDDGSRVFAFSLSLSLDPKRIQGGCLELRRKDTIDSALIPTPEFGTGILFLTGVHGYEHRTRKVEQGQRVILVGWCSR